MIIADPSILPTCRNPLHYGIPPPPLLFLLPHARRWGRCAFQEAVDNNRRRVIQLLAAQGATLRLEDAAAR